MAAPSVPVLATLGAYGVQNVHQAQLPMSVPPLARRVTPILAAVFADAVRRIDADVLLVPSSYAGREAAAVAAARLGAGFVADASGLTWTGDGERPLRAAKRVLGGTWDTVSTIASDPAIVTVRANAITSKPAATATHPDVWPVPIEVAPPLVTVASRTVKERDHGRPRPQEAATVVVGGRGVNGDFGPVADLADALGGAVGATRDAAFEGWFDSYIRQTGIVVSPRLYIGAGVSGAPHHAVGMSSSQVIVAVNNDADAPLIEMADLAVIGDLADILPQAAATIYAHKTKPGG